MKTVYIEGPIEALRRVKRLPGVLYTESGVKPIEGDRYRLGADIGDDPAVIAGIEALGLTVRVSATDADYGRLFDEHARKRGEGES